MFLFGFGASLFVLPSPPFRDSSEEGISSFQLGLLLSPIGGELTGAGGCDDGLAEVSKDCRDTSKSLACSVDLGEQLFHPLDNAFLLGQRCDRKRKIAQFSVSNALNGGSILPVFFKYLGSKCPK